MSARTVSTVRGFARVSIYLLLVWPYLWWAVFPFLTKCHEKEICLVPGSPPPPLPVWSPRRDAYHDNSTSVCSAVLVATQDKRMVNTQLRSRMALQMTSRDRWRHHTSRSGYKTGAASCAICSSVDCTGVRRVRWSGIRFLYNLLCYLGRLSSTEVSVLQHVFSSLDWCLFFRHGGAIFDLLFLQCEVEHVFLGILVFWLWMRSTVQGYNTTTSSVPNSREHGITYCHPFLDISHMRRTKWRS